MTSLLLCTLALAGEERPLARLGEDLSERLYAHLDGADGAGPVRPRSRRRRSGPYHVWQFPDGVVQRYTRSEGAMVVEERRFDAAGYPLTTVVFDEGLPATVTVHSQPQVDVDVTGWTLHPIPGGRWLAPGPSAPRPDRGVRWAVGDGRLDVWEAPAADVFSEAFREGLVSGCGCQVIDRSTTWVDGEQGVRYRFAVPGLAPQVVDLWAVPRDDGVWLASYAVDGDAGTRTIDYGRAWIALVRFGEEER